MALICTRQIQYPSLQQLLRVCRPKDNEYMVYRYSTVSRGVDVPQSRSSVRCHSLESKNTLQQQ